MAASYVCPSCRTCRDFAGPRKSCTNCGASERTRAVAHFYPPVSEITRRTRALVISPERWLLPNWFESLETSVFGGENHIDIQSIDRGDATYDWIVLNHVLEHVEHDGLAIQELRRILKPEGVLQLSVPEPFNRLETLDWGFADADKFGHWRDYGCDISVMLRGQFEGHAFAIEARDTLTPHRDWIFCLSPGLERLRAVAQASRRAGNAVMRLF